MVENDQTIQRVLRIESNPRKPNVQCYNAKGHYDRDCSQPKVRDAKYFREHMLLAMKDEAGGNLNKEEIDFMLDNNYGDDLLEELNAALILMARIQLVENKADAKPTYDVDALGEVNASHIHLKSRMHSKSVHEHMSHVKLKNAINTSGDDQINSSIIFDDPNVETNSRADEHDSNAHDKFTYAYADVRAKNQDLLITISKLKAKLAAQAKNVTTKFDKSGTLEKLICVTPLNKNKDLKDKTVSKVERKTDMNDILSQQDLDKLFGPLYEESYATRTPEVLDNFAKNAIDNEYTPSSSLIIFEDKGQCFLQKVSCTTVADYVQGWDFLHFVQQKKDQIQYPRFTKIIIANLIKKFPSIPRRLEEDYHSIKDDILLVSVYTTGNVTVRGMLIPEEFFTDDIRYLAIAGDVVQKKRKRKKTARETSSPKLSLKISVKQFKSSNTHIPPLSDDREMDEESYANKTIFKELTDTVSPLTAAIKTRRISNKYTYIQQALHRICKRQDIMINQMEKNFVTNRDFQAIHKNVNNVLHDVIPKIASNATNDIIEENLPNECADHAPKLIEELFQSYIQKNIITVHPITSSSTATPSPANLSHQLYLKMKRILQDQVDNPELWDVLKRKFEKSSVSSGPCRTYTFCDSNHNDHREDDAPHEGEKRAKRQKTSKSIKFARGSSSKQPA
nr:hypothetical protein [Tanacetum cinerariifolium]